MADEKKSDAPAKSDSSSGGGSDAASTAPSTPTAPTNYSRGEGQKNVSQSYRDNWNLIFAGNPAKKAVPKSAKKSVTKKKKR